MSWSRLKKSLPPNLSSLLLKQQQSTITDEQISQYMKRFTDDSYCFLITQNLNFLLRKSGLTITLSPDITITKEDGRIKISIKKDGQDIQIGPQPDPDILFCTVILDGRSLPADRNTYRIIFTFLFVLLQGKSFFEAIYESMLNKDANSYTVSPKSLESKICELNKMIEAGVKPEQIIKHIPDAQQISRQAQSYQSKYLNDFALLFQNPTFSLFPPTSQAIQQYKKRPDTSKGPQKGPIKDSTIIDNILKETTDTNQKIDALVHHIATNRFVPRTWGQWLNGFVPGFMILDKDTNALTAAAEAMKAQNDFLILQGNQIGKQVTQMVQHKNQWATTTIASASKALTQIKDGQDPKYDSIPLQKKQKTDEQKEAQKDLLKQKIILLQKIIQYYSKKGALEAVLETAKPTFIQRILGKKTLRQQLESTTIDRNAIIRFYLLTLLDLLYSSSSYPTYKSFLDGFYSNMIKSKTDIDPTSIATMDDWFEFQKKGLHDIYGVNILADVAKEVMSSKYVESKMKTPDQLKEWKSSAAAEIIKHSQDFIEQVYPVKERQLVDTDQSFFDRIKGQCKSPIMQKTSILPKQQRLTQPKKEIKPPSHSINIDFLLKALFGIDNFKFNGIQYTKETWKKVENKQSIVNKELNKASFLSINVKEPKFIPLACLSEEQSTQYDDYISMLLHMFPNLVENYDLTLTLQLSNVDMTVGTMLKPSKDSRLRFLRLYIDATNKGGDYIDVRMESIKLFGSDYKCLLGLIPNLVEYLRFAIESFLGKDQKARLAYLLNRVFQLAFYCMDNETLAANITDLIKEPLLAQYLEEYQLSRDSNSIRDNILERVRNIKKYSSTTIPPHPCITRYQETILQSDDCKNKEDKARCLFDKMPDHLVASPINNRICLIMERLRVIDRMLKNKRQQTRQKIGGTLRGGFDFPSEIKTLNSFDEATIRSFVEKMFNAQKLGERDLFKEQQTKAYIEGLLSSVGSLNTLDQIQHRLEMQVKVHEAKMKAKADKLLSKPSISSPSSAKAKIDVPQQPIPSANVQHKQQQLILQRGPYSSTSINSALQYLADKAKIIREHSGDHRTRLFLSQQSSFYKPLIESPEYKLFIGEQTLENLEKLINKLYIGSKLNTSNRSYLGNIKKDLLHDFLRLIQLSPTQIDEEIKTLKENGEKMHTALWNQSGTWEEKVKTATHNTILKMFFPHVQISS